MMENFHKIVPDGSIEELYEWQSKFIAWCYLEDHWDHGFMRDWNLQELENETASSDY